MEAHYTWDGRVVGQQEAGGLARSYSYQVDHTLVTDSLGQEERYHFVGSGPGRRWTAHTRADGSHIEFRYDRAGRKIATVDPLGHETLIERDEYGQVIAQTSPDGTRWAMERDALGQPVSIEGPENQRWQITRNELGHPLEVTGPEGTTAFAYQCRPAQPPYHRHRCDGGYPPAGVERSGPDDRPDRLFTAAHNL